VRILRRALEEPMRRIAANAGEDGSVIVRQVQTMKKGEGYDAARQRYGNMFEFGIIDPAKVTKAALDNAVSIAGMVLTTNCLVTDIKENDATAQAAAASGMY
jgi:chaperonin GroEL